MWTVQYSNGCGIFSTKWRTSNKGEGNSILGLPIAHDRVKIHVPVKKGLTPNERRGEAPSSPEPRPAVADKPKNDEGDEDLPVVAEHVENVQVPLPRLLYKTVDGKHIMSPCREYILKEVEEEGDGNCLFRAIARGLGRDVGQDHLIVRQELYSIMSATGEGAVDYFPNMSVEARNVALDNVKTPGRWCGNEVREAARDYYKLFFYVYDDTGKVWEYSE